MFPGIDRSPFEAGIPPDPVGHLPFCDRRVDQIVSWDIFIQDTLDVVAIAIKSPDLYKQCWSNAARDLAMWRFLLTLLVKFASSPHKSHARIGQDHAARLQELCDHLNQDHISTKMVVVEEDVNEISSVLDDIQMIIFHEKSFSDWPTLTLFDKFLQDHNGCQGFNTIFALPTH